MATASSRCARVPSARIVYAGMFVSVKLIEGVYVIGLGPSRTVASERLICRDHVPSEICTEP